MATASATRAAAAAEKAASAEPTIRQLVVFSLGKEEYALPITQVQEIIRYTEPRSVGSHIESVRGVISLRGGIVSVYDLATRLGVAPSPLSGETKIVITESGSGVAGIVVDDVQEVLTIEPEQLEDVPTTNDPLIDRIAKIDDRLVILLNPTAIFEFAEAA
jgi:purine-binding chemotaxis protein CheW